MGNIVGCLGAGLGWCCCTASMSLFTSCCGTDKPSNVRPGANSGRKRSSLLLLISIGIALAFQYALGPRIKYSWQNDLNPVLSYLSKSWLDGCEDFIYYGEDGSSPLLDACSGNSGVFRVAGCTVLFYVLAGLAVFCKPSANREAWPAKFILFFFLILGSVFIPNEPLFTPILLWVFRWGAVFFIVFNQLIILDMAYNINEGMVEKADQAELDEGEGEGRKWLGALLIMCLLLYIGSLVAIGLMYHFFSGCGENIAFITVTLVMGILSTVIQLSGEESSLFTSGCIFAYATYLLYTAVAKNPNGECNPQLGEENLTGIFLGIIIAISGLLWTGFSATAHRAVGEEEIAEDDDGIAPRQNEDTTGVTGIVVGNEATEDYGSINESNRSDNINEVAATPFSNSWKLNFILASVTCWYAMSLTSWGDISSGGNMANPTSGKVGMWMVIASQWFMLLLYVWTLVAPKLFPDRDFS